MRPASFMSEPGPGVALRYRPIGDYAFLGDCHTGALVSSVGSVDWLCWPRLDAGSYFGRLLDWERGGWCAVTTSLPEAPAGSRNWDYRASWVRDSVFALRSLAELGYTAEADGFRRFVQRSAAGSAQELQIVYGLGGERRLEELPLDDLEGYGGARPVRIGNAAARQHQHDVYGELLDLPGPGTGGATPPTPTTGGSWSRVAVEEEAMTRDLLVVQIPLLEKVLRSIAVYLFLVVALRLGGKRELAQLNSFDLVVLLLLSNTVQNAIIGPDNSLLGGLLGATVLLAAN
jgi:hypothetical protein